jgi:2'-5' RNA ligase
VRLFIAVKFNDKVKNQLLRLQDQIREQSLKGNFSRSENLHLTLVFLGETPSEQVPHICSLMEESCKSFTPFSLNFHQTGFFTHSRKELWWIGADKTSLLEIEKLHRKLTLGLKTAGINFDDRPFNPHITLGREIKRNQLIEITNEVVTVSINKISLMRSERINKVLVYTELESAEIKS